MAELAGREHMGDTVLLYIEAVDKEDKAEERMV